MSTRRDFLTAAAGLAGGIGLASVSRRANATPAAMQDAVRKVVGTATVRQGRVKLDVPPLIDNGNSIPLSVAVESPMTPANHVKAIHVFAERNPLPNILSVHLSPRSTIPALCSRSRSSRTARSGPTARTWWSRSRPAWRS
jgi:sulfur-oxidizing protein SoxY